MRLWLPVLIVLSLPALARAEAPGDLIDPSTTVPSTAPSQDAPASGERRPFVYKRREVPPVPGLPAALGVNTPLGWYQGSYGGSLSIGLSPHLAIRANVAYRGHRDLLEELANGVAGGEVPSYSGRVIDYGAGLVWYPRRRWEGFMLEAGALLRDRAIRTSYEFEVVKNWTTTLSGRGMIGWSWRLGPAFVAAAVGFSAGYEVGREAVTPESFQSMPSTTRDLARLQVDGEAYLRIGFVFEK